MAAPRKTSSRNNAKLHPAIASQNPDGRVLDSSFWLRFGTEPEPSTKLKMLYVTIDDVSRVGPSTFNVIDMCAALGIAYSLVNFHYGSRDQLLAEAMVFVYTDYVQDVWASVSAAKKAPRERLKVWIESVANKAAVIGGWGAVINYPTASLEVSGLVADKYGQDIVDLAELNLARVMMLISDFTKGSVSEKEPVLGEVSSLSLLKNPAKTAVAVSVMMSTNGLAVWRGGRSATEAARQKPIEKILTTTHLNRILDSLEK
jgi:AcrR family transcriptional regulator